MAAFAWPQAIRSRMGAVLVAATCVLLSGPSRGGADTANPLPAQANLSIHSNSLELRALEVNGQQVSAGTLTYLVDDLCLVQEDSLRPLLAKQDLAQHVIDHETFLLLTPPARCEHDDAVGLLRLQLPASWLKEQSLRLSRRSAPDPLPLLLGASIDDPDARIRGLSAAHLDLVADRHRLQWGFGAAHLGLQVFVTGGQSSAQTPKATVDWLRPSGAALRLGDQVVRQGPEQQPRSLRGLSVTNRLQVLRPSGLGQGQVALDAPARLQFFDTQGQPLFSTGLLPAGRYRLEGLGAPSLPGLLTVRIEGLSGQTETILLPWVASPLLLAPGTRQWDVWIGNTGAENTAGLQAAQQSASLSQSLAFSGLWAQGWNGSETLRIGLAREYDVTQAYAGVSSQRWPGLLVSADLGLGCRGQQCLATGGLDISGQPRSGLQWSAGLRRQLQYASAISRLAEPTPDFHSAAGLSVGHTLRLSASQRLRPGTTLTGQLSLGEGRLALVGLQQRISTRTSLQASLRAGNTMPGAKAQTTAFASLHVALPDRPSTTSPRGSTGSAGDPGGYSSRRRLSAGLQSGSGGNNNAGSNNGKLSSASISYQQSLGNTASAPQIALTKASGGNARHELRLQQAAAWGDISLQARQPQGQQASVDLSLASRVWLTAKGMHLGPVGDHNLVIHSLGHPDLRLQLGRQTAATNAKGIAAFGRTPAWTEAQFRLDTQSIPFDLHWKTSQVRLPTAARRAYWIDQTQETILVQEFRLQLSAAQLARLKRFETRNGQPVAFTPEGYLDIASLAQLPLTAVTHDGQRLTCHQARPSNGAQENARALAGDSVVWIDCPGLAPEPAPVRPQIREALSGPAPSPG